MASSPEADEMGVDSPEDASPAQSVQEIAQDEEPSDYAPRYAVPLRDLAAVEIPAVVENVDRMIKAFGRVPSLSHVLDPVRSSLPLYLNPESPFCPPIMSHSARSHNVVLKVTVPKRTGRKRKRGTDGPWQGDVEVEDADALDSGPKVCSIARLDEPKLLRRKLADNADKYQVEAVGIIKHTHRFRGLADFYWDMSKSSFAQRYADQVLPGDIQKLKMFKFRPGIDHGPNVDIIPPLFFTHMSLPFNYYYSQNPYVRTTEDGATFNTTAVKQIGYFISAEAPAPMGPRFPDVTDARTMEAIAQLEEAFEERPIWTRRSILNHLGGKLRNWNELKKYLNYAAYQFKGGPWRDSVVVYGIDPRTDPKYRIYQTLMFKLSRRGREGQTWQSVRRSQINSNQEYAPDRSQSHVFDGESYYTDSKIWQVCDITDPLLRDMLDSAAVRPECDINSGWYHGGLWAKVKAIMKTKLVAIQFGRDLSRRDFAATLEFSDLSPTRTASASLHLPLPNLNLSNEELKELRGREPPKKRSQGYNVRFRKTDKGPGAAAEQTFLVADSQDHVAGGGDSGSGGEYDEDGIEDDAGYPGRPASSDDDRVDDDDYDDGGGEEDELAAMGGTVYPELD